MTISEAHNVLIETKPPQSKLDLVGVKNWELWNSPTGKFTHTFSEGQETVYIIEGKFSFTVEGYDDSIELGVGDMANFPINSTVTFDVIEPLKIRFLIEKID